MSALSKLSGTSKLDLSVLNSRQHEAVMHTQGPLLVLAGAGSGKTRVIIYRIARLMRDGVSPDKILGVTFTNKAAQEMRERLSALAGRGSGRVTLSTFHALGLEILKEEAIAASLRPGFCIYDTADQLSLVRDLMRQVRVADRRLDAGRILDIILKTKRLRLDEVQFDWGDDYELAAFDLYPRYRAQMQAFNAIDFDDLILLSQQVLRQPEVLARWQKRFSYLLIDEYQDTSPDQLELIRALAGDARNVCAVGDDDQAIYAWRGAAVDNILSFSKHFPNTCEVVLDQNYRSTGNILAAANAIIKNNKVRKVKALWSASGAGAPVEVVECGSPDAEAEFIAEEITRLVYEGVTYNDIAVLYRSNVQSRIFEETLAMQNIPFRVVGGQAFFDRKEVRDAMAFLAIAANPYDEIALRRIVNVPPRGIGNTSLERLAQYGERMGVGLWGALQAAHTVPDVPKVAMEGARKFVELMSGYMQSLPKQSGAGLGESVREFFDKLGLKDAILAADDAPSVSTQRLDNLSEVCSAVSRFANASATSEGSPLVEFLRKSALVRNKSDDDEGTPQEVTLMTLHSAKGLEFPYVFMVGVEEELLPHKKTLEEMGGELSEERRLCYVGVTRARQRLCMSWVRERTRHGRAAESGPSRFLQELPEGDGVRRWMREAPPVSEEEADKMAADFFERMRRQLGIEG